MRCRGIWQRFIGRGLDGQLATRIWSGSMTLRRLLDRTTRIAGVLTIALAVLLPPAGHSASHDPLELAEAERHSSLAAEITKQGHDEGDVDEPSPGYTRLALHSTKMGGYNWRSST